MKGACGAFGDAKSMDAETHTMVVGLKAEIEAKVGTQFAKFEPKSYTTQVVAGTNYDVEIEVDGGFVQVRVFKPLPCHGNAPQLSTASFEADPALRVVGGTGPEQEAAAEVQALCDALKGDIEKMAQAKGFNGIIQSLTAVSHTSQVVAGTNFFVKAQVNSGTFFHLRIFQPLGGQPAQLSAIDLTKGDAPAAYFEA